MPVDGICAFTKAARRCHQAHVHLHIKCCQICHVMPYSMEYGACPMHEQSHTRVTIDACSRTCSSERHLEAPHKTRAAVELGHVQQGPGAVPTCLSYFARRRASNSGKPSVSRSCSTVNGFMCKDKVPNDAQCLRMAAGMADSLQAHHAWFDAN